MLLGTTVLMQSLELSKVHGVQLSSFFHQLHLIKIITYVIPGVHIIERWRTGQAQQIKNTFASNEADV